MPTMLAEKMLGAEKKWVRKLKSVGTMVQNEKRETEIQTCITITTNDFSKI